jgi:hypothetical protein
LLPGVAVVLDMAGITVAAVVQVGCFKDMPELYRELLIL